MKGLVSTIDDRPHMAEIAFDDQCMGANPSYTLVDDLARILREAYSGDAAS